MKKIFKKITSIPLILGIPLAVNAAKYQESPELKKLVDSGKIESVTERLPDNPRVITVVDKIGKYGGIWNAGLKGENDTGWFARSVQYEPLIAYNREWTGIQENVAESWTVSEDSTVFRFTLRKGHKWSDGKPFTAHDIVFAMNDVFYNPDIVNSGSSIFKAAGEPATVTAIDDRTVEFKFNAPYGMFLIKLASVDSRGLTDTPKHYCEKYHKKYNSNVDALAKQEGFDDWSQLYVYHCNYGGDKAGFKDVNRPTILPWSLTKPYDINNQVVSFRRNPYFYKVDTEGNQLPYLDGIDFYRAQDANDLVLRALNGKIDYQLRHIATTQNQAVFIEGAEKGGYELVPATSAMANALAVSLNLTHKDPVKRQIFSDKQFRIALSHAIDRQEIIDAVFVGQAEPFQLAPLKGHPLFNEQLATQYTEYDPDKANAILDQAGYKRGSDGFRIGPDGKTISFVIPSAGEFKPYFVPIVELVQLYWEEIGIKAEFESMDRNSFYTLKDSNQHDVGIWIGSGGGGFDVMLNPRYFFPWSSESLFGIGWYQWHRDPNGEIAVEPPPAVKKQFELYDKVMASSDIDSQNKYMKELLQISADEFWTMGIATPAPNYAIKKKNFHNVLAGQIYSWTYPYPAPAETSQYFKD